jgi:hypothetical protein
MHVTVQRSWRDWPLMLFLTWWCVDGLLELGRHRALPVAVDPLEIADLIRRRRRDQVGFEQRCLGPDRPGIGRAAAGIRRSRAGGEQHGENATGSQARAERNVVMGNCLSEGCLVSCHLLSIVRQASSDFCEVSSDRARFAGCRERMLA